MENKLVTQVAIFQLSSRERLESEINSSLEKISLSGHKYKNIRFWSGEKGGIYIYNAVIEYEMELSDLVGDKKSDISDRVDQLKRFSLNDNLKMSEIGLIGMQALVVQNGLFDISLNEPYTELVNKVKSISNLSSDDPIKMLEVPTISVNLNLGNE